MSENFSLVNFSGCDTNWEFLNFIWCQNNWGTILDTYHQIWQLVNFSRNRPLSLRWRNMTSLSYSFVNRTFHYHSPEIQWAVANLLTFECTVTSTCYPSPPDGGGASYHRPCETSAAMRQEVETPRDWGHVREGSRNGGAEHSSFCARH